MPVTGEPSAPRDGLDRWPGWQLTLLVFVPVWAIYLVTATYWLGQVNDNRAVAVSAWSLAERGTLDLPDEWPDIPWRVDTPEGETYTNRFPGAILWTVPFYAVLPDDPDPGDATHLSYGPAGVAAATVAALAVTVLFWVFTRVGTRRQALVATGVAAFGTSTWSVSADAMWTHGPDQLWLGLGMLGLAAERWAAGGLAFGLAMFTRPHTGVVAAVTGLMEAWRRRSVRPAALIAVTSAVGLLGLIAYTWALFDSVVPTAGYGTEEIGRVGGGALAGLRDDVGDLVLTFVHGRRGVLLYSPFLLLLIPGLRSGWRAAPGWVRSSAVAGVVYLLVQLRANAYHGGFSYFGNRLTLETLTLTGPLLFLAWREWTARHRLARTVFVAAVAVSVALHAAGAIWLSIDPPSARGVRERLEVPAGECPEAFTAAPC